MSAGTTEVARTHRVAVRPPQVHNRVQGLAPHRIDNCFELVNFGIHRHSQLIHTLTRLVEGNTCITTIPNRCVGTGRYVVIGAPATQQIIKSSFDGIVQHAASLGSLHDDGLAPRNPAAGN